MITVGNTGQPWRASVTPTGGLVPWDLRTPPLNWYIAADDRWHVPADEPAVRQSRIEGTAVVETRVRVPNGDVVQRIYSTADQGGITVIEVENESTLPLAVAFDRRGVLTERQISHTLIEGIDLPADAFVLPLGHAARLRIGVAHGTQHDGALPKVPEPQQVARGWLRIAERPSRFVLPDGYDGAQLVERVIAQRCEIALGNIAFAEEDPAEYAVAVDQLVRMGEPAEPWVVELVEAVGALGPHHSWSADAGLAATNRILTAAEERRAGRDLARILADRQRSPRPPTAPDGTMVTAWIDEHFVADGTLLPDGIAAPWLGQSFEVYGVPVATSTTATTAISFGVRWHGENPAVLWEQSGPPVPLRAPAVDPDWSSDQPGGEALWAGFSAR